MQYEIQTYQTLLGRVRKTANSRETESTTSLSTFPAKCSKSTILEAERHHPSLRIRKMQGYADVWEGHITMQYVFTFHIEKDPKTGETIYVFRTVGTHDIYRNP